MRWLPQFRSVLGCVLLFVFANESSAVVDLVVRDCNTARDTCQFMGSPGEMDGVPDPGESASLIVELQNNGNEVATGVTINIVAVAPLPFLMVTLPGATFPDIPPGMSMFANLPNPQFFVGGEIPCGASLVFDVEIFSNEQGAVTDTCIQGIPANCNPCSFLELGNGFRTAAPVAAKIFDYYFNQKNIAQADAP